MKSSIARRIVFIFAIILLTAFFSACGRSSSSTPAQATAATPSPTPTPASTKGFQHLTGANFGIDYPVGWQTSHKSQAGGMSGRPATEDIYGFVASDNITGLHIVRNGDEQAVGGMVNELLDGQFSCSPGDRSVPSQVRVGGVTWSQADLVCMISGFDYEVRELVTSSTKYGQTVIMYGAFQQVDNGAMAPDFAHASDTYFQPMLASFQFH
ncbi:MAG TPA: hypothetical protein VL485_19730 [Ktedonobacteraceae bacterium]|jgi:hypothetical protein|nr:hypothetical protein [Ktedonobacteraceae bacterium]